MSNRFIRDYSLIIRFSQTDAIEVNTSDDINDSFRIIFDGEKSASSQGLNKLSLQIFNLGREKRDRIFKDKIDRKDYFQVILSVGYKNTKRDVIFRGDIFEAFTEKKDSDYITNIICNSGNFDYRNSFTSRTLTKQDVIIDRLLEDMPNTQKGAITANSTEIARAKVLLGSTIDLITQETTIDANWFIDDEKLYILKDNEIIDNVAVTVSSETGLIGVPKKADKLVEATTLINPTLRLRSMVNLVSVEAENLNGLYTIDNIKTKGDTRGQSWYQVLVLRQSTNFEVIR